MPSPLLMVCHLFTCFFSKREAPPDNHGTSPSLNFLITFAALHAATGGFSDDNLLGRGGFGPVYKGVMADGTMIAVKKLALDSRQGRKEFVNEVRLLVKVQHRNLVSLLGCCVQANETMLVYEYHPNRSLDGFIFDPNKRLALDWSKRFVIINRIARGLLYLHEESPVKIIHRDIKASNILLDEQLNPKISDFGLARLFEGDVTHVNTLKASGTFGYMAPEYAINGYLSAKADVFSFGILVLEIVSGRKNLEHHLAEHEYDLLSYAWKLSQEGRALDLMDSALSLWDESEVVLCIQMGLLCCQADVAARPGMSSVCLMLSSNSFSIPKPGKPGVRGRPAYFSSTGSLTNGIDPASTSAIKAKASSSYNFSNEDCSKNLVSISLTSVGR